MNYDKKDNTKVKKYDVIIAGGGAAGLFAAICTAKAFFRNNICNKKILIIEKKDKPAKKISATGNGRCNYTNSHQEQNCYRGEHPEFAYAVYEHFDYKKTLEEFKKIGVYPKDKNGYFYPYSEQAQSVADALVSECLRLKVEMHVSEKVTGFTKNEQEVFTVKTDKNIYSCDRLIVCMGGSASPVHGTTGDGYYMLKQLSHSIIEPVPALCQLKADGVDFKALAGVRCEASGKLYTASANNEENIIAEERGEFLFAAYGISGIPVFQMSRFAVRMLEKKIPVKMSLNFLENMQEEELINEIRERVARVAGYKGKYAEVFNGLLNTKLSACILRMSGKDPQEAVADINDRYINKLAGLIRNFTFDITGHNGFENAQVTAGGADTIQLDSATMQSKIVDGLYLAGEIVDVDGTCGGYNLQWAWSSAYTAAEAVCRSYMDLKAENYQKEKS